MIITSKVEYPVIDHKYILSRISDYDIYKYECPEFIIGRPFCNWMRGEKRASMSIFLGQDGKLHHYDQGDDFYHGDCWDLVCQKYRISLKEAVKHVAKTFYLTESTGDTYKAITSQYVKPVMDAKRYALIQCATKKFTSKELNEYWGIYPGIGEEKLKRHNVYSIKEVFLNRKKIPIAKGEMVFGYWYLQGWKIMFSERSKTEKWLGNVPLDTPGGLQNLNAEHNTLIVKSLKCFMMMEEVYPYLCYMQNESLGSVSERTAEYINNNSKQVFYGGDSDPAGKKASYRITDTYHWKHVNVPDKYAPDKDWSDLGASYGLDVIRNHLKLKGIIER